MLYRLKVGTHARVESGVNVIYRAGDPDHDTIDLNPNEAEYLRNRVELVLDGNTPIDVSDLYTKDAVDMINRLTDFNELAELRKAEAAGRNRPVVINAIDAKVQLLAITMSQGVQS